MNGIGLAVGIHANAVARGITVRKLEIELEADINITAVWGTGDTSPKPVGFDAVRAKVHLEADAPQEELDGLIAHATVGLRSPTPSPSRSASTSSPSERPRDTPST